MYVRTHIHTCLSHSGLSICTHFLHSRAHSETHVSHALTIEVEDREERRFLTMEDAVDSAAGPPQRTCFAESSAKCSRRLMTLRKRKQQSQCIKEAKKARREPAKKSTLWRVFTSQTHTFKFNSTVVLLELTRMAQREASCACVILVFIPPKHYTKCYVDFGYHVYMYIKKYGQRRLERRWCAKESPKTFFRSICYGREKTRELFRNIYLVSYRRCVRCFATEKYTVTSVSVEREHMEWCGV